MQLTGMMLGCLLLAQTTDGGHPARPAEIVAEAALLPAGGALTGHPYSLVSALGSTADRRGQMEAVHAYWRLVEAVAHYRFCSDHAQSLDRIAADGPEDAALRMAKSSAAARLQESLLDAVRAQHELAAAVRLPAGSPLPLPADRPLVGAYRTSFDALFAARTPPDHARLAEKILPLMREAIDRRAEAVQAADDAAIAAADELRAGRGNTTVAIECNRELLWQKQAFIELVCRYNHHIADYGLMVVGPEMAPPALAAVLIGPPRPAGVASAPDGEQPVRAAGANEPMAMNPSPPSGRNEPTPAKKNEPTPAPPRDEWEAIQRQKNSTDKARYEIADRNNSAATADAAEESKPLERNEPTLAPPLDGASAAPRALERPVVPLDSLPSAAPNEVPRAANKPLSPLPLGEGQGEGISATIPLYAALADAAPSARAKQLAAALHDDRSLSNNAGRPIRLADCLLRGAGGDRRATIDAYWLVRQRAAECRVLAEQAAWLDGLVPAAIERRNQPSGAADMLRLRSSQLAARAALAEARAALVESQYALAVRIGAAVEAAWPLASTVPHSGSYLLKLDAQPPSVAQSWPVRRLAATMPGLGESVQQHAAAVVETDAARADVLRQYAAGTAPIDGALDAVAKQTEQTTAFLVSLTEYNRAIAEYATTVLPSGTSPDALAASLVTKP